VCGLGERRTPRAPDIAARRQVCASASVLRTKAVEKKLLGGSVIAAPCFSFPGRYFDRAPFYLNCTGPAGIQPFWRRRKLWHCGMRPGSASAIVAPGTRRAILKINCVRQDAAPSSRQCGYPFSCVYETSPVEGKNSGTAKE